jgi:hypothetical protein
MMGLFSAAALLMISIAIMRQSDYVRAGGPDTSDDCYDLGYNQGQDKPFQRGNYDSCERFRGDYDDKNPYNEGFVDGCKAVERNTEEVCERATD